MKSSQPLCFSIAIQVLFWALVFSGQRVWADEGPSLLNDVHSTYRFWENGEAQVEHHLTLTSQFNNLYPARFTLQLDSQQVSQFSAQWSNQDLEVDETTVTLPEPMIREDPLSFQIEFNHFGLYKKKGKLNVVRLPFLQDSAEIAVGRQIIEVLIPKSWGMLQVASLSPQETIEKSDTWVYKFELSLDGNRPQELQLTFGEAQLYDLDLTYHLKNPSTETVDTHIAFPPDFQELQTVFIQEILPEPQKIEKDSDGNILGTYTLLPETELIVQYRGQIRIKIYPVRPNDSSPTLPNPQSYLLPDQYWESNAPEIIEKAEELSSAEKIYQFVTQTLEYDQNKVKQGVIERVGALQALKNPQFSACMEFTDLTIALMRAAGVPAREVNGYVYLEEDEVLVKPLVNDILHAWVQYWDGNSGWVNIDPTWEANTGRDYFRHFDHDHIIFVMKGVSSTYPYPAGAYRSDNFEQQDVRVSLSNDPNPQFPSLDEWIEDFNQRRLTWWQKLWQWMAQLIF